MAILWSCFPHHDCVGTELEATKTYLKPKCSSLVLTNVVTGRNNRFFAGHCAQELFFQKCCQQWDQISAFFSWWVSLRESLQHITGLVGLGLALIHPWLLRCPIFTYHIHSHAWAWLGYVGIHVALLYMSPMIVQGTIGRATSLPDSSDIRLTQWQGNIAMRWTSNGWMRMGGVHKITEE